MAVHIRMTRVGRKKQPYYRIVAIDSRKPRDGDSLEVLGHYNPNTQPETVEVDNDRVLFWLKQGAVPSDTVRTLLSRKGLWKHLAIAPKPRSKKPKTAVGGEIKENAAAEPEQKN